MPLLDAGHRVDDVADPVLEPAAEQRLGDPVPVDVRHEGRHRVVVGGGVEPPHLIPRVVEAVPGAEHVGVGAVDRGAPADDRVRVARDPERGRTLRRAMPIRIGVGRGGLGQPVDEPQADAAGRAPRPDRGRDEGRAVGAVELQVPARRPELREVAVPPVERDVGVLIRERRALGGVDHDPPVGEEDGQGGTRRGRGDGGGFTQRRKEDRKDAKKKILCKVLD